MATYSHHTQHVGNPIKTHVLLEAWKPVCPPHCVNSHCDDYGSRVFFFFAEMMGFRACSLVLHTMPRNGTMSGFSP